jgi:tripartite-type tricarboxylate transporter receptor subunit TctC
MNLKDSHPRRRVVLQGAGLAGLSLWAGPAAAQTVAWPAKPVRLIVPFPPGSPPDLVSRLMAGLLSAPLGQAVFVENRPGAIGLVAVGELLRQPADGHTLMCMLMPVIVGPILLPSQKVDLERSLAPVSLLDRAPSVLVANNSLPASTLKEFVALLKARPGELGFASGGNGTPAHLAGELFKLEQKVVATHVPYSQLGQAIPDLINGRVQFMFLTSNVALPLLASGKVKGIGVVGDKRLPALPQLPTLAEQGMGEFDTSNWDAIVVKAGTPPEIVERLNAAIVEVLGRRDVIDKFQEMGMQATPSTPAQLGELMRAEARKWRAVITASGIKAE